MHKLNSEGIYTALQVNIQDAASGVDARDAMRIAATAIYQQASLYLPEDELPEKITDEAVASGLRGYLGRWTTQCPKPIVLFIDEADSLMDELFLALLRQLRAGFEARPKGFPQSIALVGLRDVRDYKIRIRPEGDSLGTGSPFNVKTKSLFMDGFTQMEVGQLLHMHTFATGQEFNEPVRQEIYRLTQGQPWLTNALANQIVTEILQNDFTKTITLEHVTKAREDLVLRRDTHLDSLMDKLYEPRVNHIIQAVIDGKTLGGNRLNDAIAYTQDLGLITRKPPIKFANPIYGEIIPRVMNYPWELSFNQDLVKQEWYIKDNKLDMNALLKAFQKFYRRHSEAWLEKYDSREVGRQLLLMAFLQRIINHGGHIEREMAVGNGRCDLFIRYAKDRYVIELKLKRDQWSEEDGLKQTARYCDQLGLKHGYLVLFEIDTQLSWEQRLRWQQYEENAVEITLVGM